MICAVQSYHLIGNSLSGLSILSFLVLGALFLIEYQPIIPVPQLLWQYNLAQQFDLSFELLLYSIVQQLIWKMQFWNVVGHQVFYRHLAGITSLSSNIIITQTWKDLLIIVLRRCIEN